LTVEEVAAIQAEIALLRGLARGADQRTIRQQIDRLNRMTGPFAERRMDRSVRRALEGRSIASIGP